MFLLGLAGVVMLVSFFGWIIEPVAEGDDDYTPDLTPATH